jgi:hypothetical protein
VCVGQELNIAIMRGFRLYPIDVGFVRTTFGITIKEQHNTKYIRGTTSLCSKEVGFDFCSKPLVLNNIWVNSMLQSVNE